MRPHVSGTECVGFLKQDACGNLVVASLPVSFPFSAFLPKVSALNVHWTEHDSYLSFSQKSLDWHFLALAKLRSTARVWNHQGYPILWIGWLSLVRWQLPRALLLGNSAGLPRYECFAVGSSTYPCHMAFVACLMTAFLRFAPKRWCGPSSLRMLCSGSFNMHKVVLLWYCFCCVKESVSGTAFVHGFLVDQVS
jgi:hypothetical protein